VTDSHPARHVAVANTRIAPKNYVDCVYGNLKEKHFPVFWLFVLARERRRGKQGWRLCPSGVWNSYDEDGSRLHEHQRDDQSAQIDFVPSSTSMIAKSRSSVRLAAQALARAVKSVTSTSSNCQRTHALTKTDFVARRSRTTANYRSTAGYIYALHRHQGGVRYSTCIRQPYRA